MTVDLYQSDVRALSDADLEKLSGELYEEYVESFTLPCECCTDSEWTNEAAEARYDAMRAEIRRRWDLANPEAAARFGIMQQWMGAVMLDILKHSFYVSRSFNDGQGRGLSIGEDVQVRTPVRFSE